jgi:hypothetical protein
MVWGFNKEKEKQIVGADIRQTPNAAGIPANQLSENEVVEEGSDPSAQTQSMQQPAHVIESVQENSGQPQEQLNKLAEGANEDFKQPGTAENEVVEQGSNPSIQTPAIAQPHQSNDLSQEQLNQFIEGAKDDLKQAGIGHHEEVKTLLNQELQIQGKLDQFQGQLDQFIERAKNDLSETTSIFTKAIKEELLIETNNFKRTLENKLDKGFTKLSDDHLKKLDGAIRIYTEEKENCEALAKKTEADRNALTQKEELLRQQSSDYDTKKSTLDDQERKLRKAEEKNREDQQEIAKREEEAESSQNSAKRELVEARKIQENAEAVREESLKISEKIIPDFLAKTSLAQKQVLVEKEDEDETRNMLIAHLHLIRHAFGFAKEDDSYLKRNLSETGRFLFSFLKERELFPKEAIEWKDMINEKLTEQGVDVELRIPEIGEPYEQKWMQVSGSSTGDRVEQVVNWGVMTREGIRVHKAEVEV